MKSSGHGEKPHIAFVMLLCTFCFAPYTVVLHDTETSFPLFFSTNQSNGGFLKAQGRRSSSSLDKRPAHSIRHVALYFLFCSVHGSPT
jgi:hypothetical protein